jgi:alkylhydroperoxidase family enzyme
MARIRRLGRSQVSGAARESFERKIAERGNIPNQYRIFAHRPWILSTMDAHFAAVMGSGTVPLKLKELLALQTSLENSCHY